MNLSTYYTYQQQTHFIVNSVSRFNDIAMRLSANTKVLRLSDDPIATVNAVIYRNALSQLDCYKSMRNYVRTIITKECDTLQTITNILSNINSKIIAIQKPAGNITPIIQELEILYDDLLANANSQDINNNYIFAGHKADIKPFQKIKDSDDIFYQGSNIAIIQHIAEDREMQISHIGRNIFNIDDQETIFKILNVFISTLKSSLNNKENKIHQSKEIKASIGISLNAVRKIEDNVNNAQIVSGLNLQLLDNLDSTSISQYEWVTEQLHYALGQDLSTQIALMTELQLSKVAMNSSMMIFQMMKNISLFNIIN